MGLGLTAKQVAVPPVAVTAREGVVDAKMAASRTARPILVGKRKIPRTDIVEILVMEVSSRISETGFAPCLILESHSLIK